jgi:prepilin peptidase CpaA
MVDPIPFGLTCLAFGLLLVAALHDAAARTIPNAIPATMALAGVVLRVWAGDLLLGFGIAAALMAILFVLWLRGYIGGGDMKLIPAVALALPPSSVPAFILFVSIAGGILGLIYLALSFVVRRPRPGPRQGLLARVLKAEAWRVHRRGPLPYAVAIAIGAIPIIVQTIRG